MLCNCTRCTRLRRSGVCREYCSRTVTRHLKKYGSADEVDQVAESPDPRMELPESPDRVELRVEAPAMTVAMEQVQRGRPATVDAPESVIVDHAAAALVLDLRRKHRNMTQSAHDDVARLASTMLPMTRNGTLDARQLRAAESSEAGVGHNVYMLCANTCSLQYGQYRDRPTCHACGLPYENGTRLWHFPVLPQLQECVATHGLSTFAPQQVSESVACFDSSPRCAELIPMFRPGSLKVFLSASTDGAVPWKRATKVDLWPLLIRVLNLSYRIRNMPHNLILSTLVDVKPKNMDVVLEPFRDDMRMLWTKGFYVNNVHVQSLVAMFSTDLRAMAACLRLQGPNARNGCCRCYHVAVHSVNEMVFKDNHVEARPRTLESTRLDTLHIDADTPAVGGTYGCSILFTLPGMQGPWLFRSFLFDGMHVVKNIVIRIIRLLKGNTVPAKPRPGAPRSVFATWHRERMKHASFKLKPSSQKEVDRRWKVLPTPAQLINQSYGPFQHTGSMKAADLMHLLWFDEVLFFGLLPPAQFQTITDVFSILSALIATEHQRSKLPALRARIHATMSACQNLLPINFMTATFHTLVHVVDDIQTFGSWREYWCYPFERYMAYIRSMIASKKSPAQNFINRHIDMARLCLLPQLARDRMIDICNLARYTPSPRLAKLLDMAVATCNVVRFKGAFSSLHLAPADLQSLQNKLMARCPSFASVMSRAKDAYRHSSSNLCLSEWLTSKPRYSAIDFTIYRGNELINAAGVRLGSRMAEDNKTSIHRNSFFCFKGDHMGWSHDIWHARVDYYVGIFGVDLRQRCSDTCCICNCVPVFYAAIKVFKPEHVNNQDDAGIVIDIDDGLHPKEYFIAVEHLFREVLVPHPLRPHSNDRVVIFLDYEASE